MNARTPIPLRPAPSDPPRTHLIRAAFAVLLHRHMDGGAAGFISRRDPSDQASLMLLRGAVSPTTTTVAGVVAGAATGDFLRTLLVSAASPLIAAGRRLRLGQLGTVNTPTRSGVPDASAVPWVGEGAPTRVRAGSITGVQLGPLKKLAVITTLTRELAESSDGEAVFADMFSEDAAAALDASMFSNLAATAAQPAGLLYGVNALAAGASAQADVSAVASAVMAGGGASVAFVAGPATAFRLALALPDRDLTIWPGRGVPEGRLIGVDPTAFLFAGDPVPEIAESRAAVLHMEDSAPAAVSAVGTPNTVAAPTVSLFQNDLLGVRVTLRAAWALRAPGAVAWVNGVGW